MMTLDPHIAESVIESLRLGIPPRQYRRQFTVGRQKELEEVDRILNSDAAHAHLIQGNYGEGKSHLLETIKETALIQGYVVASVTIDAQNGVRFNRMDQIVTAVARSLTFNGATDLGIGNLFSKFIETQEKGATDQLKSYSLRFGVNNWARSTPESALRSMVRDCFYSYRKTGYIDWQDNHYCESWRMLNDLATLATLADLKGLVIFFDEFEDVIQNLNNRTWQQKAFENFFNFTNPSEFHSKVFFGVTPEFTSKTISLMRDKGFGSITETKGQLQNIPKFRLKNLTLSDFRSLAHKVCEFHAIAYQWDAIREARQNGLDNQSELAFHAREHNSTRGIVQSIIGWLDNMYETRI